mmetsp:Transcript_10463/g.32456  ORF Transcript_10463/g.32456 Transcript_10463/m.32456 type:complete len:256 (-) Transcript_10463:807-1574(-)
MPSVDREPRPRAGRLVGDGLHPGAGVRHSERVAVGRSRAQSHHHPRRRPRVLRVHAAARRGGPLRRDGDQRVVVLRDDARGGEAGLPRVLRPRRHHRRPRDDDHHHHDGGTGHDDDCDVDNGGAGDDRGAHRKRDDGRTNGNVDDDDRCRSPDDGARPNRHQHGSGGVDDYGRRAAAVHQRWESHRAPDDARRPAAVHSGGLNDGPDAAGAGGHHGGAGADLRAAGDDVSAHGDHPVHLRGRPPGARGAVRYGSV